VCKKRDKGDRDRGRDRGDFSTYHVMLITPPPKNLGIHCLEKVKLFIHDKNPNQP
jgi:hypothetical protein